MVFTSLLNWLLFAALVTVYWLMPPRVRMHWLAAASVLLLAFNDFVAAVVLGYLIVLCLAGPRWAQARPKHLRPRIWLLALLALLPLVVFKYPQLLGFKPPPLQVDQIPDPALLALPIGISYISFKALMYVLDTTRGKFPLAGVASLIAFLGLAPTASSGPIDRPAALIAQIVTRTRFRLDLLLYAGYRIVIGVIFKFAIADTLMDLLSSFRAEILAVSLKKTILFGPIYAATIYFDFAGYSHIAIGAAALLGLRSMENFAAPYLRRNIAEFWRAWHISLTSFLRDYIFLPLGYRYSRTLGPRNAAYLATIVTFVACGVWHGSGWNFVLWGLYHGVLLVLHQLFRQRTRAIPLFRQLRKRRWLAAPSTVVTFLFVCGSWYLFAFTLPQLVMIFGGLVK